MFDKIYYIFHSSIRLKSFAHAERASFLLSTSISLYVIALYMLATVFLKLPITNILVLMCFIGIFIVANGYITSHYFVGTRRYRRIIEKYGSPRELTKGTRLLYILLTVSLSIGSFMAFAISGMALSRYLHP